MNPSVLRAILKVESNFNPRAVGRNENGTIDVGVGQINSMHFPALREHGVQPSHLLDACVGTYVAAWHLSKVITAHGNTWEAIARYHSATPYFNNRYRVLLNNELVRSGAIIGSILAVPPMRSARGPATTSSAGAAGSGRALSIVSDIP